MKGRKNKIFIWKTSEMNREVKHGEKNAEGSSPNGSFSV